MRRRAGANLKRPLNRARLGAHKQLPTMPLGGRSMVSRSVASGAAEAWTGTALRTGSWALRGRARDVEWHQIWSVHRVVSAGVLGRVVVGSVAVKGGRLLNYATRRAHIEKTESGRRNDSRRTSRRKTSPVSSCASFERGARRARYSNPIVFHVSNAVKPLHRGGLSSFRAALGCCVGGKSVRLAPKRLFSGCDRFHLDIASLRVAVSRPAIASQTAPQL